MAQLREFTEIADARGHDEGPRDIERAARLDVADLDVALPVDVGTGVQLTL